MKETSTGVRYKISYGPEDPNNRNDRLFDDVLASEKFFDQQQKLGKHVDAYRITTTITIEKLT